MRRVIFQWKATKEIIADGLTKALPKQRFQSFVNMIGIVDIKEQLNKEKQLEDLRENIRARRKDSNEIMV
jgi:hypothetical protein